MRPAFSPPAFLLGADVTISGTPSPSTSPMLPGDPAKLVVSGLAVPLANDFHRLNKWIFKISSGRMQRGVSSMAFQRGKFRREIYLRHVDLRVAFAFPATRMLDALFPCRV